MASGDQKDWSRSRHEVRGSGRASRIRLNTGLLEEAGWKILSRESGNRVHLTYVDPEGKKFKSSKDVERKLEADGILHQFVKENSSEVASKVSSTSKDCVEDSDEDYKPPLKKTTTEGHVKSGLIIPEGLFVGTTSSILQLVRDFNNVFCCPSYNRRCEGKLVLTACEKKGFGGAMMFTFKCCGCWTTEIDYKSSQLAQNSRRQIVSLALSLAFFISGHGYASYRKTLGRSLGLGVTSEKPFLEVIDLALPHIKDMLDEMCDDAKHQMKQLSSDQIGSWSRAVTCCDGCWLIRGHFSQNCTFVVKNYITSALLYYGHLSMRGADRICDEDLWEGTAKSAEGHLSQKLWAQAKEEGMKVEINWQDADSSSAKGFRYSFSNEQESRVMLCGGHVGRAHGKKLEEIKGMSTFTPAFIALHKSKFPGIESVKCSCAGKKHTFVATRNKPVCGCIGPGFIQNAKRNHYCALVQAGCSPEKYRDTMLVLGKYHSRDIHEWEGGSCSFHPLVKCSCKECVEDENGFYPDMKCQGQPYRSAHPLKSQFHGLAYEIECAERAKNAKSVIDPELGKGHSNLPEATFSVLTKFRAKDTNLHQKHYQASTNLGLIQSNMSWLFKEKGAQYHWIVDLYSRMGLPILSGIQEMCQHDNEERMKRLERYKTDAEKQKRVQRKKQRADEQELRKKYVKRCRIRHTYGEEEEEDGISEEEALQIAQDAVSEGAADGCRTMPETSVQDVAAAPENSVVTLGGKNCKWCGSSTHSRKTHKDCPHNPKHASSSS